MSDILPIYEQSGSVVSIQSNHESSNEHGNRMTDGVVLQDYQKANKRVYSNKSFMSQILALCLKYH